MDGFDFSTSVSICQALDLDEDEGSSTPTDVFVVPKKVVKGPAELGNVLLKALGVNKDTVPTETKEGFQQYATNTGEYQCSDSHCFFNLCFCRYHK